MNNNSAILFKIAGILAIISGAITCLASIATFFISLAIGIPLIIVGKLFLKYATMDDEELILNKSAILGWSIFLLFFCSIAGILALVGYSNCDVFNCRAYDNQKKDDSEIIINTSDTFESDNYFEDKIQKLERLKSLKDRNIISNEEFEILKSKILKED